MYELGRADGHLSYKQVIHVANTVFGDVSKNDYLRPVDIRDKRRPITFCLTANDAPDVKTVKEGLVEDLRKAIRKSAIAALEHIHEELKPFDNCEQVAKELKFQKKFIFNDNLKSIKQAISENKRILRVLGVNGVGKTRLVIETLLKEESDILMLARALDGYCIRSRIKGSITNRMKVVIEKYSDISRIKKDNINVEELVDSRDYYAHFMPRARKEHILEGLELHDLTQKVRRLVICCVLSDLGLDNKAIDSIFKNSNSKYITG